MHDTWYVLEDGRPANPDECAPDNDGVLRHKSGVAVATRGGTYSSRGMSAEDIAATEKDLKPEAPKRGYKTREIKGR